MNLYKLTYKYIGSGFCLARLKDGTKTAHINLDHITDLHDREDRGNSELFSWGEISLISGKTYYVTKEELNKLITHLSRTNHE